jgi:hypothetical protein
MGRKFNHKLKRKSSMTALQKSQVTVERKDGKLPILF